MKGSVYKRCSCPVEVDSKGRRKACKKAHGSWFYVADLGSRLDEDGKRKRHQVKRGGFATKAEADAALVEVLDSVRTGQAVHDDGMTVKAWLDKWLGEKVTDGLRPTTAASYRQHIDSYLIPHVGHLRLRDVRPGHVDQLLRDIAAPREKGKPMSPATVRRVHATLRSAFATAKRRRLIPYNPAADLDLPKVTRPAVRPWGVDELGRFLDSDAVGADPLGPLYELAAMTGLRRGELCGLRWQDVDLTHARLTVAQQVVQVGHATAVGKPKTPAGEDRVVDLDERTVGALLAHRLQQDADRVLAGSAWVDTGLVFTRADGTGWHPEIVTKRFRELVKAAGVRGVRLHDLRHGQASLMLAAGVPMATVSKRLGHSSIAITADTYSHLLEGVGQAAAQAAADLVPRATPPLSVTNR